jgi:hypothetical protein
LFASYGGITSLDLWVLSLGPPPVPQPMLRTDFDEHQGVLSPDGRWMAFVSDETGASQVYVQSFPDGELRQQLSSQEGTEPQWRADGRELYFLQGDRTLMAAPVSLRPTLSVGIPGPLFRTRVPVMGNPYRNNYVASADGQRFLVNTAPPDAPTPAIHVVLDWRALLSASQK